MKECPHWQFIANRDGGKWQKIAKKVRPQWQEKFFRNSHLVVTIDMLKYN